MESTMMEVHCVEMADNKTIAKIHYGLRLTIIKEVSYSVVTEQGQELRTNPYKTLAEAEKAMQTWAISDKLHTDGESRYKWKIFKDLPKWLKKKVVAAAKRTAKRRLSHDPI